MTLVRDCLIRDYQSLISTIVLPDLGDRHVLAAAIHGKAEFIVTFNLKDFPTSTLAAYNIEAIHPDEFILDLLTLPRPERAGILGSTSQLALTELLQSK